jgi:hypothetical protein
MTNTKTPSIRYVVGIGYNHYIFDTIEKAARIVDLLAQGDKVSYDYNAPQRDDHARSYYIEKKSIVADIEVVNVILNTEPTPERVADPVATEEDA